MTENRTDYIIGKKERIKQAQQQLKDIKLADKLGETTRFLNQVNFVRNELENKKKIPHTTFDVARLMHKTNPLDYLYYLERKGYIKKYHDGKKLWWVYE